VKIEDEPNLGTVNHSTLPSLTRAEVSELERNL